SAFNEARSAYAGAKARSTVLNAAPGGTFLKLGLLSFLAAKPPKEPIKAYIWYEKGPKGPSTHRFQRGDPTKPAEELQTAIPAVLSPPPAAAPKPTKTTTGRRLWLARWLSNPANPLVARVVVNRVWQHHFGQGIVATANDFGEAGQPPSHPEL